MSIRKIIGMDNGVSDFRIQVAPKLVTVPKNCKSFAIYLEKGMQVIGKFQSDPNIAIKDSIYRFRSPTPAQFRIFNLANASYTWSLYSLHPQSMDETFQDSAVINLQRTVKLYQMELVERQRQVQTSFRQKSIDRKEILQLWTQAKRKMQTFKSTQKCVSANQGYQIEFTVEIKNVLDEQLQKVQVESEKSKIKRVKSDDYSSIASQSKLKNTSQLKQKQPSAFEAVQVSITPYKLASQIAEEINTRETIEEIPTHSIVNPKEEKSLQDTQIVVPESKEEDFNAVVKIVTPTGQQLDANEHQNRFRKIEMEQSSNGSSRLPTKKFSLLSDIIQLSFEGSSSYGHPDFSSSNGFKHDTLRKDGTMDMALENDSPPSHPLNKFKTLPYQSHHKLEVRDEFRRAHTAEKEPSDMETSQIRESFITNTENEPATVPIKSSGDPYGKWIIITAFAIIFLVLLGGALVDSPRKKPKAKVKAR